MALQRILPSTATLPLFDASGTRAIERHAMDALATHTLMQRAGLAAARLAQALAPHAQRVWIVAGPGNNGGDGFEAAHQLAAHGIRVHVTTVGEIAALTPDTRASHTRALASGARIDTLPPVDAEPPDLAIDALLGLGASRPPEGPMAALIRRFNALPCVRLAIDLPSGLRADTGTRLGEDCVEADHTLAMLTLKPGLFTASGRDQAGTVWLDTLEVDTGIAEPAAWLTGASAEAPPARRHAQHKGSFGDLAVVGGAAGMTGAALLAARAAHAAGAGRVFVSLLDAPPLTHDPLRPELMFRAGWPGNDGAALRDATVVCGCGGGDAVRAALPPLLGQSPRLVLDADALNAIATDTMLQALLQARAGRGHCTVLTPHPLEAARLLGSTTTVVQSDRLAAARELAARFHCTALLKGSGTVIASPGRAPAINPTGNASLAGGGTGDVLAGWLGGLWAQWTDPALAPAEMAHAAAVAAAYGHGAEAERAGLVTMRAGDLIDRLNARRRQIGSRAV